MSALEGWDNFHVIVGSSAGALIGLQFVFIALIADRPAMKGAELASAAFSTPSVVHFGMVLLLSAVASAPWRGTDPIALLWGLTGLYGAAYTLIVARRMRRQVAYQPVFEDRLFHLLLPFASYLALAIAALTLRAHAHAAPFGAGAALLLLLFLGIRNTWDAITYFVFTKSRRGK